MASELLAQISTDSLADLLQVVGYDLAPPGRSYLDGLDDLLLQASERAEGLGQGLDGFRRGDMVEVNGPAGSGKTELLYFLALTRALPFEPTLHPRSPTTHRDFPTPVLLGGHGQTILIFAADASGFSLVRLASLMREHVWTKYDAACARRWGELYPPAQRATWLDARAQVEGVVRKALDRVRVCRLPADDSWALAAALGRIEDVVLDELPDDADLGLVLVDGFGAGFWPDALAASATASTTGQPTSLAKSPMYHVLDALTHVRQAFSPLVVLTTQALPFAPGGARTTHLPFPYVHPFPAPRSSTAAPPVYPPPPPDGIRPITHLVVLQASTPPTPSLSLQRGLRAALQEEDQRRTNGGQAKLLLRGKLRVVGDAGREGAWEGRVGGRGLMS